MRRKWIVAIMGWGWWMMFTGQANSQTVTLGFQDNDNFPFQIGDGAEIPVDKPGIAVELIQMMGQQLKIKIQLKRFPWKRGLEEMKDGRIDGLFNASYKGDRLEFGLYPTQDNKVDESKRSYANSYSLYRLKGSQVSWNGEKILNLDKSATVGAPRGFSIVGDLTKMGVRVEESKGSLTDFRKLILNRISAVAALELAGDAILSENVKEFASIEKVEPPLQTKPYYLMLSHQFVKKHPELAQKIWDTIEKVRTSPSFNKMSARYFE